MPWSLRDELSHLGWAGTKSVARDLFGYRLGRIPTNPDGSNTSESLVWWATRDKKESFYLNVILVGVESFTNAMLQEVDIAVHRVRRVYDVIGVGVLWAWPWFISTAEADGLDVITTSDEIDALLEGWAIDNAGIDLYFPAGWSVSTGGSTVFGRSAEPGPCPGQKDETGPKGSVAGLNNFSSDGSGIPTSSRTAAHEVGHYLSLIHRNTSPSNLMCQTGFANNPNWQQVAIADDQAEEVRVHCMVMKIWT